MGNQIPRVNKDDANFQDNLAFEIWSTHSSSDTCNGRNRPYNGQEWTTHGKRGEQVVSGLTMRDVYDCLVKAFLLCSDQPELSDKVGNGTWREQDVFKIDLSQIGPIAVAQTMGCEIEKMMDIYPNAPELSCEEIREELFGIEEVSDG